MQNIHIWQTHTHSCVCTRNACTSSGLQWVIKQLTFDKWIKTVVVSAGPGQLPLHCREARAKNSKAKFEFFRMTSAPIHIAPARQNECTSTCRKQVATPGTGRRENRQVREYPAQLCVCVCIYFNLETKHLGMSRSHKQSLLLILYLLA